MIAATLVSLFGLCVALPAFAAEVRVAAASNVARPMRQIAERFEQRTQHEVVLAFGATGMHYAQIHNGAPFHVFFAADSERPRKLEEEGLSQPGTRFTYAVGKLVLWSPNPDFVDAEGSVLEHGTYRHLALANPRLAPYGRAGREALEKLQLWERLRGRIVTGENIAQTFQFVHSGNAELGIVAWSQIARPGQSIEGSWWEIPPELYAPIEQQVVLLEDDATAREFLAFVRSDEAREVLQSFGYGTP